MAAGQPDLPSPEPSEAPSPAEAWCQVLESYDLDREQAEALTRIVMLRSESWQARCRSLISDAAVREALMPSPTDPAMLQRGLELYLEQRDEGAPPAVRGN